MILNNDKIRIKELKKCKITPEGFKRAKKLLRKTKNNKIKYTNYNINYNLFNNILKLKNTNTNLYDKTKTIEYLYKNIINN